MSFAMWDWRTLTASTAVGDEPRRMGDASTMLNAPAVGDKSRSRSIAANGCLHGALTRLAEVHQHDYVDQLALRMGFARACARENPILLVER
jgi:hypothetical protein